MILDTLFNIGSQLYNYGYQRDLQQQIFQREDNALQRRMADAEAAGLNKFSVANGSGAGAGSVVSTSAPQADFGNTLDQIAALNQVQQVKAQTQNVKTQNDILKYEQKAAHLDYELKYLDFLNQLGMPAVISNGEVTWDGPRIDSKYFMPNGNIDLSQSPRSKMFDFNYQNEQNNAALMQTDVDYQEAMKVFGLLTPFLNGLFGLGKSYIMKK